MNDSESSGEVCMVSFVVCLSRELVFSYVQCVKLLKVYIEICTDFINKMHIN